MVLSRLERARATAVRGALGSVLLAGVLAGTTWGAAFAAGVPARPFTGRVPDQYWLAGASGAVWPFGGAANLGGVPEGVRLSAPVVAVSATPTGNGYWLVTSDGSVFGAGSAGSFAPGTVAMNKPVVDMAPTPDGLGYWLLTTDGSVFGFGDARLFGVAATVSPAAATAGSPSAGSPLVDMAPTPDGLGYWLLRADGTVASFGDAVQAGSAPVPTGGDPAERIVPGPNGDGYWVVDQNGTATPLGDAAGRPPAQALLFSPVTPGDRAVLFALHQLGKPYVWGGTGPRVYDCSGLAYRSWYEATGTYIPRLANAQYHGAGTAVAWPGLQAGDLVFWGSNHATWQSVYHTAIYVGGSQIIEAADKTVQLGTLGQWGGGDLMGHGVRPS
jgi:cell wall-associated NlpC family hydrolase